MNQYTFDGITYKSKFWRQQIEKYILRAYNVSQLEEYFNGNKCYYSSNYAKLAIKADDSGQVYLDYANAKYRCGRKSCKCSSLNPQSFVYLTTCAGLSEEEARFELTKKQQAGVRTQRDAGFYDDPQNNPFSKAFWTKKGYSEEEAQIVITQRTTRQTSTKIDSGFYDDPQNNPFSKAFWTKKGYSEEEAQFKVNSRNFWCKEYTGHQYHNPSKIEYWIEKYGELGEQKRRDCINKMMFSSSLEGYISRFGEIEGKIKFKEKQLKSGGFNSSVSNTQKKFFKSLYKLLRKLQLISRKHIHIGLIGQKEFKLQFGEEGYRYDCYIPEHNLIIEFNGVLWHPRKDRMSAIKYKQWKMPYDNNKDITAEEKERKDLRKIHFAQKLGYNVLEVWDSDSFPDNVAKCLAEIKRIENEN